MPAVVPGVLPVLRPLTKREAMLVNLLISSSKCVVVRVPAVADVMRRIDVATPAPVSRAVCAGQTVTMTAESRTADGESARATSVTSCITHGRRTMSLVTTTADMLCDSRRGGARCTICLVSLHTIVRVTPQQVRQRTMTKERPMGDIRSSFPPVVYAPTTAVADSEGVVRLETIATNDNRIALFVYSALDRLQEFYRADSPWALLSVEDLQRAYDASPYDLLFLDKLTCPRDTGRGPR